MSNCKMCGCGKINNKGYCPLCWHALNRVKKEALKEEVLAHADIESAILSVDPPEDVPQDGDLPF